MSDEKTRDERRKRSLRATSRSYEPAIAKLGKALRAKLRDRLPGLFEIVYVYEKPERARDLVFTDRERLRGAVRALAVPARGEAVLRAGRTVVEVGSEQAPCKGRAKVRHVVLNSVADFDRAEIEVGCWRPR